MKLTDRERAERYKMALEAIFESAENTSYSVIKRICAVAINEGES